LARHKNTSSWDVILNLSCKCYVEWKWNIPVNKHCTSVFGRIIKRLHINEWCNTCYRKKECPTKIFFMNCAMERQLLKCNLFITARKKEFVFRNECRQIINKTYPFVSNQMIELLFHQKHFMRYQNGVENPQSWINFNFKYILEESNKTQKRKRDERIKKRKELKNKKIKR